MSRTLIVAVMLGAAAARAQESSAPDTPTDSAADHHALELYSEAIRAESLGKLWIAEKLALEAIAVAPNGQHVDSIRRLLDRLELEPDLRSLPRETNDPSGSRFAYVLSATFIGIAAGLAASAPVALDTVGYGVSLNGGAILGLGALGAAVGLAASLLTLSAANDGSVPLHLWAGTAYAIWTSTSLLLITGDGSAGFVAVGFGGGLAAGALTGALIGGLTRLTPADGLTSFVLGNLLASETVLLGQPRLAGPALGVSMLAAATLGFVGGEILNTALHWSTTRWGLILLAATLGAGLSGIITVAALPSAAAAMVGVGALVGFGVGCVATLGMNPDRPRGGDPAPVAQALIPLASAPRSTLAWVF